MDFPHFFTPDLADEVVQVFNKTASKRKFFIVQRDFCNIINVIGEKYPLLIKRFVLLN